jgi:acyl-CoA dehydrogenase
MDFAFNKRTEQLREELADFMHGHVLPAEPVLEEQLAGAENRFDFEAPIKDDLKNEARSRGLWNLFLPDEHHGAGLTNLEYAPLAEITGWSPELGPESVNCSPPDTGNMELLHMFATPEQSDRWLVPLLEGEIRSCFSMTEPAVASSDASNIETRIERDGDDYVINGRKWWSSAAMRPKCKVLIVMGVSDPSGDAHRRHSMILVPKDTPGVHIKRSTSVFGYDHASHGGHAEIVFDNVRLPADYLLGEEGGGFAMAQARLGPGRIHHCMRLLGQGERALELLCKRVQNRVAFGKPLKEQGVIQEWIAESRIDLEQARLLVLKTAWLMDTVGNKGARTEISAIKVVVPNAVERIVDRAIQAHGAGGVSDDFPLARFYTEARYLRIGDGPDEVHKMSVARRELRKYEAAAAGTGA